MQLIIARWYFLVLGNEDVRHEVRLFLASKQSSLCMFFNFQKFRMFSQVLSYIRMFSQVLSYIRMFSHILVLSYFRMFSQVLSYISSLIY